MHERGNVSGEKRPGIQAMTIARGDTAPVFRQRTRANPNYVFDTAAGRYLVLCFLGSGGDGQAQAAIRAVRARSDLFDDAVASFFGVTNDKRDETAGRLVDHYPGYRYFWDFDLKISRLYGAVAVDAVPGTGLTIRRHWVVLDPTLRVLGVFPFREHGAEIADVLAFLEALPPPARHAGVELQAPVLILPNVFEPELCAQLIASYRATGGEESGFMRNIDGKTSLIRDDSHKRRRDHVIDDERLIAVLKERVGRRINPQVEKAFQFVPTRMERYIVACYSMADAGHFRPHRDNTTPGTAHRRFAVSLNLNADFDGGELGFPEYGPRGFKMPVGAAAVFSCSLLHTVSPVTRGARYAFLPFLYDEAAARQREANDAHLAEGLGGYRSGLSGGASETE